MPIDWTTILLSVITALTAITSPILIYITNKTHKAVNSSATAATAEIQRLNALVSQLTALAEDPHPTEDYRPKGPTDLIRQSEATRPPNPNAIKP
jgi:hypothetical protein